MKRFAHCPRSGRLLAVGCALALLIVAALFGLAGGSTGHWTEIGLGLAAVGMAWQLKDVDKQVSKALPSSGGSSINTDGIDVEATSRADFQAPLELLIEAPALDSTELPDGETTTYKVEHDDNSDFSAATDLYGSDVLVQTGAGGSGADAAEKRVRLPSDVKRHVRVTATTSSTTGDQSGSTVTASLVF